MLSSVLTLSDFLMHPKTADYLKPAVLVKIFELTFFILAYFLKVMLQCHIPFVNFV